MEDCLADIDYLNANFATYIDEHFSEDTEASYINWLQEELPTELRQQLQPIFTADFIEGKLGDFVETYGKLLRFCGRHATVLCGKFRALATLAEVLDSGARQQSQKLLDTYKSKLKNDTAQMTAECPVANIVKVAFEEEHALQSSWNSLLDKITIRYHDKGQGPLYPKWPVSFEEARRKPGEAEVQDRIAEVQDRTAGTDDMNTTEQHHTEMNNEIVAADTGKELGQDVNMDMNSTEVGESNTVTDPDMEQEHDENSVVVVQTEVRPLNSNPKNTPSVTKSAPQPRRSESSRFADKRLVSTKTLKAVNQYTPEANAAAAQMAAKIVSMFRTDDALTDSELAIFLQQYNRLFSFGRTLEHCFYYIEKHVIGRFDCEASFPQPCQMAALTGHADGPGGSEMTQNDCKYCTEHKLNPVSCYAVYAEGVQSLYGPRINGKVSVKSWIEDPQPRAVAIQGQQARWILKRRKARMQDVD
jgi:hypothetical protein